MCGRITRKIPRFSVSRWRRWWSPVRGAAALQRRARSQEHWVIRQHPETGEHTLDRLTSGLIPGWIKAASPKVKPINATAERVARRRLCQAPLSSAYRQPLRVEGNQGARAKQPYAIGMKSREPFALAAICEGWRHPK
jgi:putative SOS response-associated peptidase YedK